MTPDETAAGRPGAFGSRAAVQRAVAQGARTAGARRTSVGVDVGGTFTDLVALGADGRVHVAKVLTTTHDRSEGVRRALDVAALAPGAIARFVHGTTVVTNLLLERAGARVVLIATHGFTDLLWLRRQERAALYDLTREHPAPLVAATDVIGVHERVAPAWHDGDAVRDVPEGFVVLEPLHAAEIARVVAAARATGAQAFAVALLHGYAWHAHEAALAAALRDALPDAVVAASHEVLPEIREYERTATTVAEAYARPAVRRYLGRLGESLLARGLPVPSVMTSAGGTLGVGAAAVHAASLALSGPAGGVTAAAALCRALDLGDALTIDIGGTSADVGLVLEGEPLVERGGDLDGVPIALPRVLVETVAAGGGSIARVDAGGALQAGPESAGADPGPACYGRGGSHATVTDAHVVLGHIAVGRWSGAVTIDATTAHAAIARIARALGRSVPDTARAIIATADATMARALRRISVERGRDPRDLVLLAFGGGGPLHACGLADLLGMRRVFVPPHAGVLSALGLALAPEKRDALASLMVRLDRVDFSAITHAREQLVAQLDGTTIGRLQRAWVRARHVGQGHELEVPLESDDGAASLGARFAALHRARFGYALERPVELVSLRVVTEGAGWPVQLARAPRVREAVPGVDDGAALEVTLAGPATVRLPDATMRVEAGWRARALPSGGWMLDREAP
jgi:N-methylhydantoinase A